MRPATSASRREAFAYVFAARSKRRRAAPRSISGEDLLNRSGYGEDAPIAHRRPAHHQPDRRAAAALAGQRCGATVEEVDEPDDAQDAHVPAEVRLVAGI